MTLDQAKEFIKSAISLACYRDGSSGGVIRMISITEAGCERFFIPYEEFSIKWADTNDGEDFASKQNETKLRSREAS